MTANTEKYPHVKQVSVSNLLRAKQYIIPSKLAKLLLSAAIYQQFTNTSLFQQTIHCHPKKMELRSFVSLSARPCRWICSTA